MHHELKFRVWDKEKKYYLLQDEEYHFYQPDRAGEWQCPTPLSECLRDKTRYIVQLYTGLKDIHNKDVYEGDVIKFEAYSETPTQEYEVGVVCYDNAAFWVKSADDYCYIDRPPLILGTVLEHDHLLCK